MKKSKVTLAILIAAAAAMGMYAEQESDRTPASPRFAGLGELAEGLTYSVVNGISADGKSVVGYSHSAKGMEAFRWTAADGMKGLGFQNALATSEDGSVVVGQTVSHGRSQPVRWTLADGVTALKADTECRRAEAHSVTADGATAVGVVGIGTSELDDGDRVGAWVMQGKAAPLIAATEVETQSEAFGVSADGRVVVGARSQRMGHAEAFRWTNEAGLTGLGYLPGHTTSVAYAVSADGTVIVGCSSNYTTTTAFRWSEETGMVALSEQEELGGDSMAYAVSADGAVAVGSHLSRFGQDAVIWSGADKMRRVRELLPSKLVHDWRLQMATAVSADGVVVAGVGRNSLGNREAWVARLNEGTSEALKPIAFHDAAKSPKFQ